MSQTRRVKTTAPTMTTMLIITPSGLRHSRGLEEVCPSSGAARFDLPCATNSPCPLSGAAAPGDGRTPSSFLSCAVGGVAGAGTVGGVVEFSIGLSGFEKGEPHNHRPQDRHAEVNKARGAQMRIELKANQKLANDDSENEADDNAHHPSRKI